MGMGNALSREQQNSEQNKPHHTKSDERKSGPQLALFTIKREKPVQSNWAKPKCEQPRDHDEADLCQQIDMSHAANNSAFYSFIQALIAGLTFGGLVFTIIFAAKTAKAALDAAKHGNAAAAAAQDSASAARAQITLTENNAQRELRAYIHVEDNDILYLDSDELQPNIRIRLKNYGSTPAHRVNHKCSYILASGGTPGFDTLQKSNRYFTLGPSQDYTTTMLVSRGEWDNFYAPKIMKREGIFYVYGEITYFDVFQNPDSDRPHFMRYRVQIEPNYDGIPEDGGFIFSPEGNVAT
jgi:hypothetical protein